MEQQNPGKTDSNTQDKHRQISMWMKPSTYRIMQAIRDGLNVTWERAWIVAADQIIRSGLLPQAQIKLIRSIIEESGAADYHVVNSPFDSGPGWSECGPLVARLESETNELLAQFEELFEAIARHQNAVLSYQPPRKDYDEEFHTIQIPKSQLPSDASTEDIVSTLKPIIEAIQASQKYPAL